LHEDKLINSLQDYEKILSMDSHVMMIETRRFGKCNTASAFIYMYIQCKLWINTFHRCISCNPKYVQRNFQHASGKDEGVDP